MDMMNKTITTKKNQNNNNNEDIQDREYDGLVRRFGQGLVDTQLDLEKEAQTIGFNRYMKNIEENRAKGVGSDSGVAKGFLEKALPLVVNGLNDWFTKVNNGQPGKRHKAASLVKDADVEVIAFVALRSMLSDLLRCPAGVPLSALASYVAEPIQDEIRFSRLLQTMNKKDRKNTLEGLSKRVSLHYQKSFLRHIEGRMDEEGAIGRWKPWSTVERISIGTKLIELVAASTGMVYIEATRTSKDSTVNLVHMAQAIFNIIDTKDLELASATSVHLPMVIEPKPWDDITNGGYYLQVKRPLKLVRCSYKDLKAIYGQLDMVNVYKAVNAIQSTAWAVNTKVLDVAHEVALWNNVSELIDMPAKEPGEMPIRPLDATEEEHKAWKKEVVRWYQADNKRKGRRFRVDTTLSLAEKYRDFEAIYFPHNVDFRGRVYPVTNLNPQGDDLMKAVLTFSKGKPLGERGGYWLAYHGGNLYGLDKKPADERVEWVNNNTDLIVSIAENPLDDTRWMEADEPFQFLAFCFEWVSYLESGRDKGFLSRLPIAFDGSCSGLQHFSAMLRDEIGGNAVNLVPHDTVQDVYSMVATKVLEQVEKDAVDGTGPTSEEVVDKKTGDVIVKHDAGTHHYATEWLAHGITRSVVKRSVMTLAYGSKEYGFADQILEDTIQPALEKNPDAFKYPMKSSRYLAKLVWKSVQGVVVKACEAMAWLQTAAGSLAAATDDKGENIAATWFTPAGFPIRQRYTASTIHKIDTILNGMCRRMDGVIVKEPTRIIINVQQDTDKLDTRKQRSGIAPNFVHSMDASHLMLTVCACVDYGVDSFAMIHDSYGCHAGNAQTMFDAVRDVFVNMYNNNNVLDDFREQCNNQLPEDSQLPAIPSMGSLTLDKVRESKYAFA